ncbi:MAG TPA: hypothetical protein VFG10_05655 [Saprospiraceae bacterium]|nr:hypothetical protein [Saprospiraceae bacterium]
MKTTLLYTFGLIMLLSCHKDGDKEISVVDKPDPPAVIVTTKLVTLSDTASAYSSHIQQTFGGTTASFDPLPYVYSKGNQIDRNYEPIRLVTADQLEFMSVQSLIENDVNYVHLKYPVIETFSGSTTSPFEFILIDQSKIKIPAHTLTFLNNDAYEGEFKIYASGLDPVSDQSAAIPSFTGLNNDHQQVSLLFIHCFFIEVRSENGEKLKFKEGAFISTSSSFASNTWSFDSEKGTWYQTVLSERNKINLSSNGYYGEADEKPMTRVSGTLDINGIPAINQPVTFSYEGIQRTVYTTNSGKWAIQVPAETECNINIELACNKSFLKVFTTTNNIEQDIPIHIENAEFTKTIIKGIGRDCNADALKDHLIILTGNQNKFLFNPDPDFIISLPVCSDDPFGIMDVSPANAQSGPTITWTSNDTIDTHSIFACDQARNEYLTLTVSGDHKIYWNLESSLNPQNRLIIENSNEEPDLRFQIAVTGDSPGKFTDNMLNILFEDMHLGTKGYSLYCPSSSACGFTDFTLTHFPQQAGEWIRGYFSGKFWVKTFNPLTAGYRQVEGEFQVYREF